MRLARLGLVATALGLLLAGGPPTAAASGERGSGAAASSAKAGVASGDVQTASVSRGRSDRSVAPGVDPACPGGKVSRLLDCPEVVCPCQRGRNVVLARAFDPETGCCNAPSCDELCAKRSRCPRFECPCGVPGDRAAATDEKTGKCITKQSEVCRRACSKP